MEGIGEYTFGQLGVKSEEVQELYLNIGKSNVKQILFKPLDMDRFTNNFPDTFGKYFVEIKRMSQTEKNITFTNVSHY